jgi:hypothetical protein
MAYALKNVPSLITLVYRLGSLGKIFCGGRALHSDTVTRRSQHGKTQQGKAYGALQAGSVGVSKRAALHLQAGVASSKALGRREKTAMGFSISSVDVYLLKQYHGDNQRQLQAASAKHSQRAEAWPEHYQHAEDKFNFEFGLALEHELEQAEPPLSAEDEQLLLVLALEDAESDRSDRELRAGA